MFANIKTVAKENSEYYFAKVLEKLKSEYNFITSLKQMTQSSIFDSPLNSVYFHINELC